MPSNVLTACVRVRNDNAGTYQVPFVRPLANPEHAIHFPGRWRGCPMDRIFGAFIKLPVHQDLKADREARGRIRQALWQR